MVVKIVNDFKDSAQTIADLLVNFQALQQVLLDNAVINQIDLNNARQTITQTGGAVHANP